MLVSGRFRLVSGDSFSSVSESLRNHPLDQPCQVPVAGYPSRGHQLSPIPRKHGPRAIGFLLLVDQTEPHTLALPFIATDGLTAGYNRLAVNERLAQRIEKFERERFMIPIASWANG
jgi:hypothetical protein